MHNTPEEGTLPQRPIVFFFFLEGVHRIQFFYHSCAHSLSESLIALHNMRHGVVGSTHIGFLRRLEAVAKGTWWGSTVHGKSPLRTLALRRQSQKH